ncbi:MAG: protein kinase [Dehalococcoidia bacterium]
MANLNDLRPGARIGDFILDEQIGSGGFGTVWRGHVVNGGEQVAIKLLNNAFGSAEMAALRADVEVLAAAAAAESPHVVRVLSGGSDPAPYIVMEYIEGTDLEQRLATEKHLSVRESIDVALAITDALRALYDAGIIHRDIKPANVLIDPQGVIKLADFGIAKIVGYNTLTAHGQTAMTMAYAAPELWDTSAGLGGASNRSDLYAMGILLYQCLVGALPFVGNFGVLYRAHAEQTPDLNTLPPDTPPSLRQLIRRCLAKPQSDRPSDAAECIVMLRRAEAELSQAGGTPVREPSRFGPWIKDALHESQPWSWRCHHESTGEQATIEVQFADSLEYGTTLRRAVDANPSLVPGGAERLLGTNRLLLHPEEQWLAAPAGRFQFWVAREDAAVERAAVITAAHLRTAVAQLAALLELASSQGLSIISPLSDLEVRTDGSIYLRRPGLDPAPADLEECALTMLRRLPLDAAARSAVTSTSSFPALVAIVASMPVTAPPAADAGRTVIAPGPEATRIAASSPAAPPAPEEASSVATILHSPAPPSAPPAKPSTVPAKAPRSGGPPTITLGGRSIPLLPVGAGVAALAALAAGAFLVLGQGGGDDDNGGKAAVAATSSPAATATATSPTAVPALPLVSLPRPTGGITSTDALLFMTDRDGQEEIYIMNPDGSNQTRVTTGSKGNRLPDALPDGSRVAFVSERNEGSELYLMNGDGTDQKLVTTTDGIKLEPSFSPDGRRVVFEVKRGDVFDLYVMNVDGTGLRNLTNSAAADIDPSWSVMTDRIVFGSDRDGNMDIWIMNGDGTNARKVSANAGFEAEPDWSPDGKRIVFQSNRSGNFDLYVINDDGTGLTRLTTDPRDEFDAAWSPDGKTIAYTLVAGATSEVYVINADGTNPKAISNNPANDMKPAWTAVRRP